MITRFAPSPTGPLHLGHAFSACTAYDLAARESGTFLLRIEDIDRTRSRSHWEVQIYEDLHWLGLSWPTPVMRQSERSARYAGALDHLWSLGLLYPCVCTRRDIAAAASAPQEGAPLHGPDGLIYPGTCRPRSSEKPDVPRPNAAALRLNMRAAMAYLGLDTGALSFTEMEQSPNGETSQVARTASEIIANIGDVVLSRRDFLGSYHLSVVCDDADQGITDVVRGRDLFDATPIHVVLQRLLDLPTPRYHHHRLIRDASGKRLAKRDDARALATYRAEGKTPTEVRALLQL